MTGNNPKSLRYQAACIRQVMRKCSGPDPMYAALEHAAANLDKMADAAPVIKAVMSIYEIFPDASDPIIRDVSHLPKGKTHG